MYHDFSPEIWNKIHQTIQDTQSLKTPRVAVFDADGTLWDNDAGNSFFDYEIKNKLIPLPKDPWKHVYALKEKNATEAFLWLAQIHEGVPLKTIRGWAQASYDKNPTLYFPAMQKWIALLKEAKFEVYVVTASVKWAVEPCVKSLGIPESHVLGFETQIQDGVATSLQKGPSTYRQGKMEALLEKTQGVAPIFACGNTMGDFWLLKAATHFPLAVRSIHKNSQFQDQDIGAQELALYDEARKQGWATHNFIDGPDISL